MLQSDWRTQYPDERCLMLQDGMALEWRVHLLRRDPTRLPLVGATLLLGFVAVYLMFQNLLPAVVAVLLLVASISEYLFPIHYRITAEGIQADALTSRMRLSWQQARRLIPERQSLLVSPLLAPSRLDAFRGVLLRFAPDGQPGDRASVVDAIGRFAPGLIATLPNMPVHREQEGQDTT
ncbi:MAG: hypothetical protein RMJ43_01340 [Chloroherpetonaceae bacterium]|nr:hypothetical protein [Chthonomonadaceae bacterium]MDW8206452.1 hypothetical protein [Chloroherpetonaceae bacterium]